MKPYKVYPSESTWYEDRISGQTVRKMTAFLGHSSHPYFTDDGWFDGDRKMLFQSDRGNARNMHCVDIDSGEIAQLTNMPSQGPMATFTMQVNHVLNETYYTYNRCVYAVKLDTLETRPVFLIPNGFNFGGARPTAGGKHFVGVLIEDYSDRIKANLTASYIGFREIHELKPDCRIVRVNVLDNTVEEVWREKRWVGHVNPSPTADHLLTFCHEGPWNLVDHRMWVLDMNTGKAWKIRERRQPEEMIGHEYWFRDGVHVGYQVHNWDEEKEGSRQSAFGFVKYDNTGELEADCIAYPGPDHIHSNGFDFVVSDSGKHIKGYLYNGKTFDGPRILCMHDGSFDWGAHHPHPAMTRDGKHVVFNSTAAGYCNIYMAAIPEDFYSLPEVDMGKKYSGGTA